MCIKENIISIDNFTVKEKLYYERANNFYCNLDKETITIIYSIITKKNKKNKLSLRFLDWFVTKYCKLYNISITVDNEYNSIHKYDINNNYKAQLKALHKNYLDPFKRTKKSFKFIYKCQGYEFTTSLCQLNFLKWIIEYDILKYVMNNYEKLSEKVEYVNKALKKKKELNFSKNNDSSLTVDLNFEKISNEDKKKLLVLTI